MNHNQYISVKKTHEKTRELIDEKIADYCLLNWGESAKIHKVGE